MHVGIDFTWNIVGPYQENPVRRSSAHRDYFCFIGDLISRYQLLGKVVLHRNASDSSLRALYEAADVYVQPSLQEGFCLSALDAAFFQLPIIGSNIGAIPDIVKAGKGICVDRGSPEEFVGAIVSWFNYQSAFRYREREMEMLRGTYDWSQTAARLVHLMS
jgi:glycosyltransferase involved in cell wall biosynthesis